MKTHTPVFLIALAFVCLAVSASAQPIHHHPQKAAYASPAEWPIHSGQAHWPDADPTRTCHVPHVEPQFPYGAELDGSPFVVPFTLRLFHCAGRITSFDGEAFAGITWDATGTSTPPVMRGDPAALVSWTGKVTIAPQQPRNGRFFHPHGWNGIRFGATAQLDNGDIAVNNFWTSFYSIADPRAPEVLEFTSGPTGGDYAMLSERANFGPACASQTPRPPYSECASFGDMITEINDWVPLTPISKPWTTAVAVYNYTAGSVLPNGRFEQRQDLDLHNGVRGTLIDSGVNDVLGFTNRSVTFDPAVLGPGLHKEAIFWTQTFAAQSQTASALIVVPVSVDLNAPPPPPVQTCTDPKATNVGGPLPCVFPPPPPPPPPVVTPTVYTFTCDASGKCTVVIK